jgi:hypothetical protein
MMSFFQDVITFICFTKQAKKVQNELNGYEYDQSHNDAVMEEGNIISAHELRRRNLDEMFNIKPKGWLKWNLHTT